MANTVNINNIPGNFFELQDYSIQDDTLITNSTVQSTFNPLQNYISYFIYNLNNEIIYSNEAGFSGWSFIDEQVYLDPQTDLERVGYTVGNYNTLYNFLNNEVSSSIFNRFYIDEISPDRTEVRLNTTQILNVDVVSGAIALTSKVQNNIATYFDFYLNFGQNQLIIANNILLDNSDPNDPTVLIKLYEPLPLNFNLKDECWIVTQVAEPIAYNINIVEVFESISDFTYLKGPNVNLNIKDQINNSTAYTNYSTLSSSSYATGSSNLQYQINSILAERGVEINVDYSDYNNFIYFSSALTRLENFYYKLQLIEDYTYSASLSNLAIPSPATVITSKNIWEEKINEIITTFDGYDYFLYYESGSASWPKTNSTYPYNNVTTNSVAGIAFIQSQSVVAGEFDENNNNALINAIPSYLREDSANAQYELFIEMLGEMFDNIWIYYQDVTEKWNADNRLQYGVSKDLVAGILRDLGLKIYQSGFGSADLYTALLGVTPSGSDFPFPYMTGSLPTPTGFEYINSSISASNTVVPLEDIEKGTYKRLYHNLPLLLKKKGTTVGLQDLITVYGIPSTILRVAEFGGKDKVESLDWDYWQAKYNYAFDTAGATQYITSSFVLNSSWNSPNNRPEAIQFRFKPDALPVNTGSVAKQALWAASSGTAIYLRYTGSGYASSSAYSGSIVNPYYQYANLDFVPNLSTPSISASIYLPFFNGDWWSVLVDHTSSGGNTIHQIFAGNTIYNGDDGSTIGFLSSASITNPGANNWAISTASYFGSTPFTGPNAQKFSGSFQEVRYYSNQLSASAIIDYIMNPDSIREDNINSAPNVLAFRASLGGELYTGSVSIHPKVTGSWVTTSSFASNSNFYISSQSWVPNTETIFLAQPAAGIKNIVSNKIQVVNMDLPSGNTLSQYRSIQQQPPGGSTYTENLAYTEVAFSPQNEINDDIMNSLGFFNMGEFIGDPRQRFTEAESYPDLDALRDAYFEKYVNNYDLNDYIRLIKFFDNSLFKMIKDFTPARASLASGVVIKQTLLERNKYPQPEVTQSLYDYSGSIYTINGWDPETEELIQTSRNIVIPTGGAGGSVNQYNNLYCDDSSIFSANWTDFTPRSVTIGTTFIPLTGSNSTTAVFPLIPSQFTGNFNWDSNGGYFYVTNPVHTGFQVSAGNTNTNNKIFTFQISSKARGIILEQNYTQTSNAISFVISGSTYYPGDEEIFIKAKVNSGTSIIDTAGVFIIDTDLSNITGYYDIVNCNSAQAWAETVVSPQGAEIVVHSDQSEFYDGEYSGSVLTVENGELNEANPFKEPNRLLGAYTIVVYSTAEVNSDAFFNSLTTPNPGELYVFYDDVAGEVKALKIATVDSNGIDNRTSLEILTSLTLEASSFGSFTYTVVSLSDFTSWLYYEIVPSGDDPSTQNEILDYTFIGRKTINTTASGPNTALLTVITDAQGDYNATLGTYTFERTTNVPVSMSATVSWTNFIGTNPSSVNIFLSSSIRGYLNTVLAGALTDGGPAVTVNYVNYFYEGEKLAWLWNSEGAGPYTGYRLVYTGSLAQNTTPTIVNPVDTYLDPNIYSPYPYPNSDYNPLINNAVVDRVSEYFQDVDYATNQLVPVNFQRIISGTAEPAAVQDSNYTSYRVTNPRYNGSKNTTDGFNNANVDIASSIEADNYPARIGISQFELPSVDLNQTYFAYFNWAGGTSPEWGDYKTDRTTYSIRFFIDESGSIIRPLNGPDGIALGIMNQNFIEDQNAVSSLLNTNITSYNTSILNGTYPIFKSGKTIQPILYNQISVTGSNGNVTGYTFTSSIQFEAPVGTTTVTNWGFNAARNSNATISRPITGLTSQQQIGFTVENSDAGGRYDNVFSLYTFNANTDVDVSFRARVFSQITQISNYTQNPSIALEYAIQKSSDGGTTWTNLAKTSTFFTPFVDAAGAIQSYSRVSATDIATSYSSFNNGDIIRVALISANSQPNGTFNVIAYGTSPYQGTFYNLQSQAPTAAYTASTTVAPFFITGSSSRNILTASAELGNLYGLELKMQDIQGSGFSSVNYPFVPQPYDEIRFEAVEANSYIITNVNYSGSLYLTLDKNITPATNINQFLIRRYVDDPAFLILDVDKPAGSSGGGIVKPEFLISRADLKIDQIIQDLEERGLLPTQ